MLYAMIFTYFSGHFSGGNVCFYMLVKHSAQHARLAGFVVGCGGVLNRLSLNVHRHPTRPPDVCVRQSSINGQAPG